MGIGSSIALLMSDQVAKLVFQEILKNRSIVFKELMASLGRQTAASAVQADQGNEELKKQVETAVSRLKEADLIKERSAPIEDFNSYYVTSDGLTAERQLRLADTR